MLRARQWNSLPPFDDASAQRKNILMSTRKTKSNPDPTPDHNDHDAAAEGMRACYTKDKILAPFK